MLEDYVYKDNRRLRRGYTTGSCAAAAAYAAAEMAVSGGMIRNVSLMTPKGVLLQLEILDASFGDGFGCAAVKKDAGDDADITNQLLIYARVILKPLQEKIEIDGGEGVGRVTQPGLDQPVGNAAINRVPRKMIQEQVIKAFEKHEYMGGALVEIFVPSGKEAAKKTFNPRLGIEGGISILGTSGIVEPMSETALVDTIETEMRMWTAQGAKYLIVTPGNYGTDFLRNQMKISMEKNIVKCSNFIGETVDMAYQYRLKGILLVGHIGKLVKLGAGIMNTHSRNADGRMEVLASCGLLAGAPDRLLRDVLKSPTTDAALGILEQNEWLEQIMQQLMQRIEYHLEHRVYEQCEVGAIVFSNRYGLLGKTKWADELLKAWKLGLYGA